MDNEQLEFKIGEICDDCESMMKYGWSKECDHDDWHVISVTLSAKACDRCHEIYHMWDEAEDLCVDWDHIKGLIDLAKIIGTTNPGQEV
jgi:hypothetical protein